MLCCFFFCCAHRSGILFPLCCCHCCRCCRCCRRCCRCCSYHCCQDHGCSSGFDSTIPTRGLPNPTRLLAFVHLCCTIVWCIKWTIKTTTCVLCKVPVCSGQKQWSDTVVGNSGRKQWSETNGQKQMVRHSGQTQMVRHNGQTQMVHTRPQTKTTLPHGHTANVPF